MIENMNLSPLETNVVDALAARHRLGETQWSIKADRHTRRALNRLQDAGIIEYRSHTARADYVYAWLTEEATFMYCDATYVSPLEKRIKDLEAENAGLRAALKTAYRD